MRNKFMKPRPYWIALVASLLIGPGAYYLATDQRQSQGPAAEPALGSPRALEATYARWAARYTEDGGLDALVLSLGYSKGLSAEATTARGQVRFDVAEGSVSVTVNRLPRTSAFDVWVVDNRPGPGHSVRPESGDRLLRLGTLERSGDAATLEADLAVLRLPGFQIDLVAVAPSGKHPGKAGLLFGSPSLFQRLYYRRMAGALTGLGEPGEGESTQRAPRINPLALLVPRPAFAVGMHGVGDELKKLIAKGEKLFFNETFDGNGRTCGTCHRAENNFSIDPKFIATLPDDDPLFVAEFTPALAMNFENPTLMREFGLILENQDGFGDLANNFNMRGVPHTLALPTSVDSAAGTRLGWSGDAVPALGSVRDFAPRAVTQHFTKTLNRKINEDFRLPTDPELDALEAFQLSLGRQEELALPLLLKGTVAARGQEIFLDNELGKCSLCHANAGANGLFGGGNGNFDTDVEELPDQPADLTGELNPPDDGFGNPGNGEFNTPTLVEAADTGPFFHNNSIETIEGAVAFYNGDTFNSSPAAVGGGFPVGPINLDATQVVAVAAFLRVINALENIRFAIELEDRALDARGRRHGNTALKRLLRQAVAENGDAMEVLDGGGLHPQAVAHLKAAGELLELALETKRLGDWKQTIRDAIERQEQAREEMLLEE